MSTSPDTVITVVPSPVRKSQEKPARGPRLPESGATDRLPCRTTSDPAYGNDSDQSDLGPDGLLVVMGPMPPVDRQPVDHDQPATLRGGVQPSQDGEPA